MPRLWKYGLVWGKHENLEHVWNYEELRKEIKREWVEGIDRRKTGEEPIYN